MDMNQEKPTIKLIAQLSGVSRGTVDRVLNNRPNVKRDKAERVRRIVEKLQYRPNLAARALAKKGVRRKIGVLFPDWPGFFEKEIRRGIAAARNELSVAGIEVLVTHCLSKLPDEVVGKIDELLADGAQGLAVCAMNSVTIKEKLLGLREQGIPVVTFNSDIADSGRACFIGQDIGRTGTIAAGLMERITAPESRILIAAGNIEFKGHRDRVDSFRSHWRGLGRSDDACRLVQTYNDYDTTFEKITAALAKDGAITGIYMANESVPACVEAIGRLGPARRVRVVGHDLSPEHRELLLYGAVDFIIGQDIFLQGYKPVATLARLLDGRRPENETEMIGVNIITAESVV